MFYPLFVFFFLFLSCSLKAVEFEKEIDQQVPVQGAPNEPPSLTGDWYGARKKAREYGVDITANYANDLLGNPIGGKQHGFANAGSFAINLDFDLEKIFQIYGLHLFNSVVVRHGNNLAVKIGNQFPPAQLFGTETYILNELYLKEVLLDDRFQVKAGRLNAGLDFLASLLYANYVNNAFYGNPISIFFNTPFRTFPNATWGAYLHFKPHPTLFFRFACYNNNTNIFKNKYHGANFTFQSPEGLLWITEWAYLNNQQKRGLPGNYRIGGYYVTERVSKFEGGSQKGNYGFYFLLDQMIYQNQARSITPFTALLFAPKNRNLFPFFMTAGMIFHGFVPSRKNDSVSLGAAYGAYSSDLRQIQRLSKATGRITPYGNQPQTAETVLELNYWLQINQWVALTPDLQYIINPKGLGTIQNALVLGMQIIIDI